MVGGTAKSQDEQDGVCKGRPKQAGKTAMKKKRRKGLFGVDNSERPLTHRIVLRGGRERKKKETWAPAEATIAKELGKLQKKKTGR